MAGALFQTIREQEIVYSVPPASFSTCGQRIRFVDDVISQKTGTCIDLALLYSSCLEDMGIHPLIVLFEHHALAGAWLEDRTFSEIVVDNSAQIINRFSKGVDQLFVVECTLMCNNVQKSFDRACADAEKTIVAGQFKACVDVSRARDGLLTPMPLRIEGPHGWEVESYNVFARCNHAAPLTRDTPKKYIDKEGGTCSTKKEKWEQKLLDLTLRTNLLNMRFGRRLIPLAVGDLDSFEDLLAKGTAFVLAPKPKEWGAIDSSTFGFDDQLSQHEKFLAEELNSKKIRSLLTQAELSKHMTSLYRASRSSLDETGTNNLFFGLGALKWTKLGEKGPHYAPLVLIPVKMIKESANRGYSLAIRDEEPQVNCNLLELLHREFGIDISCLNPLPADDHGVDTRLVFNTFKRQIMDQRDWKIQEIATLGVFSFNQYVMWEDIRKHEDELRRNKIVASLLDGHLTWKAEPMVMPHSVDRDDTLLAIEADASQLFAIKEAAAGKSFVLHGPPGTGKSQVITGIIANTLAHNQRALFVSEKAAALDVVEQRLEKLGIGKHCLELHSNKSSKAHVLDQLQQATETDDLAEDTDILANLQETKRIESELNTYINALFTINEAGLTLREQICRYQETRDISGPNLAITRDYISSLEGKIGLENDLRLVERLAAASDDVGSPSQHPLKMVLGFHYSQNIACNLYSTVKRARQSVEDLVSLSTQIASAAGIDRPLTEKDWLSFDHTIAAVLELRFVPRSWLTDKNPANLVRDIERIIFEKRQLDTFINLNTNAWSAGFFSLEACDIEKEWAAACSARLFRRKRAMQDIIKKVGSYSVVGFSEDNMPQAIDLLKKFSEQKMIFEEHLATVDPALSELKQLGDYDWGAITSSVARVRVVIDKDAQSQNNKLLKAMVSDGMVERSCCRYGEARESAEGACRALELLVGGLRTSDQDGWALQILRACDALENNASKLKEWMRWRHSARLLEKRELNCVVEALIEGVDRSEITDVFKKSLYRTMCSISIEKSHVIGSFSNAVFEREIKQYAEVWENLLGLSRKELCQKLDSRVPNLTLAARKGSEASILKRAIRSKGRNISIRTLFSQIPSLLSQLAPCMLMSPLSVAQYLDFSNEPFDLVIFDEASQLQTCKAVGALARAKNVVIVGDPKQMPPTTFFQKQMTHDGYCDDEDLESILDDCLAINMPETYLQWHYRSRHESLISFSNAQFYEGKMCTFPSVDDISSRVSLVHVHGYYEGDGLNSFEAQAIVEEIKLRYDDRPNAHQSIGVITFNARQQNRIEDMLDEEYGKNPSFEDWAKSGDEPLFIKNLENVQGDERDVILFSVTYAPNMNGKILLRFGPINSDVGWRRLNVAITRSRSEMKVFATLKPEQIDLNKTGSEGVKALHDFLEFARRGKSHKDAVNSGQRKDRIAEEISCKLEKERYYTDLQIGSSSFKVDIGVSRSGRSDTYMAGILLDGESYLSAHNTYDREVAREKVLESLGWNLFRIWTIDWWADSSKVMNRLTTFLSQLQNKCEKIKLAEEGKTSPHDILDQIKKESTPLVLSDPDGPERQKSEEESLGSLNYEIKTKLEDQLLIEQQLGWTVQPSKHCDGKSQSPSCETNRLVASSQLAYADNNGLTVSAQEVEYYPVSLPLGPRLSSDQYQRGNDKEIRARFEKLIDHETPIERSRLCNRVRDSFGIARSGRLIQEKNDEILNRIKPLEVNRGKEIFVWKRGAVPSDYRLCRIPAKGVELPSCNEICDEELIMLFILVLGDEGPLSSDTLIKSGAIRYGYKKVSSKMRMVFLAAIDEGKRRRVLREECKLITIC